MTKSRLEAFSDGVLAIIITIMVLELSRPPHGAEISALRALLPVFGSYVLSFIYVGIYWSNHHHLLHAVQRVSGSVLWANFHLLFWLSLTPLNWKNTSEPGSAPFLLEWSSGEGIFPFAQSGLCWRHEQFALQDDRLHPLDFRIHWCAPFLLWKTNRDPSGFWCIHGTGQNHPSKRGKSICYCRK